jgi:hypothetical protein
MVSLLFGGLHLSAVFRHFDLRRTLADVRQARLSILGLGIGLMMLGYLLRAVRWRIWERNLSYRDSFRLILVGFMGNNLLPARVGEIL